MAVVVEAHVVGAEKLYRLAEAIRRAGHDDLQKELVRGLRRAVRPMTKDFRDGALALLPHRGGLDEWVASGMRFRSSVSIGSNPRLRITASDPGHDLNAINRGRIRHRVYGVWRAKTPTQIIRPGFFDDAGNVAADKAYDHLEEAVDIVAEKLEAAG